MTAIVAAGTAHVGTRSLTLDLTVDRGEVVALVGPNGSGKSTTLDVLVGLRELATGRIEVEDHVVADADNRIALPPGERGLGWVPQTTALLPRRRVIDQLRPFARPGIAPLLEGGLDGGLDELLGRLDLDEVVRRRPDELSGGQAQRVSVARALASSRTVLLDEATSAQDPDGARAIRAALRAHADLGGALVVVAHRPEDAWVLADRAIVLEDLAPVQMGPPDHLASHPATPYVAQVAGVTVLRGTVDDQHVLHTDVGNLVVSDMAAPGRVTAMIRPSAVTLHAREPHDQSARNVIACTVRSVDRGAAGLRVVLDGRPPLTAALTQEAADALGLRTGAEVWASCKATDIELRPT